MLENSDLSKKVVKVTDADVHFYLTEKERKNEKLVKETKNRLKWANKEVIEKNKVENLFSPDIANFLISSDAIRVGFDYNEQLDPMTIRVTHAKMGQTEKKVKGVTLYTTAPHYNTHIINGEETTVVGTENTNSMNQKLEGLLPRQSDPEPSETKSFRLEADRMTVSIHPGVEKNSPSLETFETFVREKYAKEMRSLELRQENGLAISRGDSFMNARFAAGTQRSAARAARHGLR